MNYLNDIWNYLLPMIDWVVFALVIASGYFIRATPILKSLDTTVQVLIISTIVTGIYALTAGLNLGIWVASFFLAFGFHSAVLKLLERLLFPKAKNQARARGIGGELPDDDDEQ
jgi:hypothetical protein